MSNSTFNKILSIVIALLLWIYVIGEVNPTTQHTFTNVPVSLVSMETLTSRNLAVAGDSEYTVDIVVEGQRADVSKLTMDEVVATADLFGFGKGQSYIEVSVKVPENVKKIEVRPARIPVNIEELVAVSKPVRVTVSGLETGDQEVGNIKLKPSEIEVTGAKSQVDSVEYIQATLDATKVLENGSTLQVTAVPIDGDETPVRNVRLSSEYVEISAKLFGVKTVKLNTKTTGELAEGYEISSIELPETIRIKGSKSVLRNLSEVSTEPIDITDISSNTTQRVKVNLPDGVELANTNKTIEAKIYIRDVVSKEFEYSSDEIQIEGLSEGYEASIQTSPVILKVIGEESAMGLIQKEDFTLSIDLSEADTTTASAKVIVNHTKTVSRIIVTPEKLNVTVNEES
ncbi:YbbR-like domain-containing protein [Sinanaerobacter sp. ZZT-01]|uniref:CdaR family protein n=1 Tax=Sinanaerobacter sp. ZZT-01 TaxID=3111540 RepID=UPI002D77BFBD|nr:CdaR family protein [Sinanaerobacter sp. ZZT-01]WRR94351.1 CdaR family protein [Sinanaerobacter sp. ZZT-01]